MTSEKVTIDGIMDWFKDQVEARNPVSVSTWLDGCQKVIALLGVLDDRLIESELAYRRLRAGFIEDGKSASESEARSKASDMYKDYLKLKAKREQVQEFIQASKARSRVAQWDQ